MPVNIAFAGIFISWRMPIFSFFSFHEKRARQVILEPSPLQAPSLLAFQGLEKSVSGSARVRSIAMEDAIFAEKSRCVYMLAAVLKSLWPSHSCTLLSGTPLATSRLAQLCLRS